MLILNFITPFYQITHHKADPLLSLAVNFLKLIHYISSQKYILKKYKKPYPLNFQTHHE